MSQRGATRPEMNRSSEVKGGLASRAMGRARAPFDRNRVVGAPRHHSSERGKIRLSSPYASLETYATEYYEQHYRQADTAGRDVRRARRVLRRSTVHEEEPPADPRPRPHDAARRRGLSLRPAASWSDVATLCAHARRPGRSWATNVSRSRSVHPPASSQMVTGRTKRPASYRAGHARGRRTAARREDVVGCATRVAWAAA